MNNIGSRNYIIAKRRAATLGDTWYETLGKGALSVGTNILNWYGGAKQSEVYEKALTAVTSTKVVDYTKIALIGGGLLAAVLLLRKA
jgi:hypothetical protein